jgi:hypothetical protein
LPGGAGDRADGVGRIRIARRLAVARAARGERGPEQEPQACLHRATFTIRLLFVSATYRLPAASNPMPYGSLNWNSRAGRSGQLWTETSHIVPLPATVWTIPLVRSMARTAWL